MSELEQIIDKVINKSILKSQDIPSLDLYMDQIMTLFETNLNDNKRYKDDKLLTKTMINNYSKAGIIKPVKGKKYTKEQIIGMLIIYNLKNIITIQEIKDVLSRIVETTDTLLLPNDLQHLKRGGRLTPLAATLGGLLKIKPILKINKETNGKIDVVDKVRTMHKAMDMAIEIMRNEHVDDSYMITVAHADDAVEAEYYMNKIKAAFPNAKHQIIKLVSVVGVHTGRGCQAVQYFKMIQE